MIIAIDNTTAVIALKERIVYFEPEVDLLLREVEAEYTSAGWDWKAIHIKGTKQPADEPSRFLEVQDKKV